MMNTLTWHLDPLWHSLILLIKLAFLIPMLGLLVIGAYLTAVFGLGFALALKDDQANRRQLLRLSSRLDRLMTLPQADQAAITPWELDSLHCQINRLEFALSGKQRPKLAPLRAELMLLQAAINDDR